MFKTDAVLYFFNMMFTNPEPYCKITFHGTGTLLNKAFKILDQFKECPFIT